MLSSLIAAAIAVPGACGGKTSTPAGGDDASTGDDAGASGSSSGSATSPGSSSSGGTGSSGSGGSTSSSGVDSGSSGGSGSGSSSGPTPTCGASYYALDPTECVPQLTFENSCGCQWFVQLPCNAEGGPVGDAGPSCDALCTAVSLSDAGPAAPNTFSCVLAQPSDGHGVVAQCFNANGGCIGGRAPRGFAPSTASASTAAGAHLARMAQLEAASVDAFHMLHADLVRLGAPNALRAAVLAAARDEVRHARMVGSLAARFGAKVPRVSVPAACPRSVEELAIENAVEGCVREAFGAAIAAVQAERASDARVRRTMRVIARDELGHAALAWEIARWLESRLDAAARRRVAAARLEALRALASSTRDEDRAQDAIGLPGGRAARAILDRMWSALESGDFARAA